MNIDNMPDYMEDVCIGDMMRFQERAEDLSLLCRKAIKLFGTDLQRTIAMEELGELITEIAREVRGTGNRSNLIEELVDADIMLIQLKEILFTEGHLKEYLDVFHKKMDNLEKIIKDTKKDKDLFRAIFMNSSNANL